MRRQTADKTKRTALLLAIRFPARGGTARFPPAQPCGSRGQAHIARLDLPAIDQQRKSAATDEHEQWRRA